MSVAWTTIAVGDLDHYLVAEQTLALRSAALAEGQADPFTEIMPAVVRRIRNQIEACSTNRLSATENTVPPSLKDYACFLILEEMALRIPQLEFTAQQAKMADVARDYLKKVATCDAAVETPPDPLEPPDVESRGAVQVVTSTRRVAMREQTNGL